MPIRRRSASSHEALSVHAVGERLIVHAPKPAFRDATSIAAVAEDYACAMGLEEVTVTPLDPERLRTVLTPDALAAFEHTLTRGRELLESRTFWNVNSTAHGGGVAEMLRSLIGYARGGGIDARWMVIEGDAEFFRITKRLHNRLHGHDGDGGPLGEAERAAYERMLRRQRRADGAARSPRGRRAAARSADGRDDPAAARDGGAGHLARAHGHRPAQRPRARGLAVPDPLRRARRRLCLLASGTTSGRGSIPPS